MTSSCAFDATAACTGSICIDSEAGCLRDHCMWLYVSTRLQSSGDVPSWPRSRCCSAEFDFNSISFARPRMFSPLTAPPATSACTTVLYDRTLEEEEDQEVLVVQMKSILITRYEPASATPHAKRTISIFLQVRLCFNCDGCGHRYLHCAAWHYLRCICK